MSGGLLELLLGDSITRFVFFPTIAVLPLLFLRRANALTIKLYTLAVTLVELGLIAYFVGSRWSAGDVAGVVARDPVLKWIDLSSVTIFYEVGMDGISLPLVLLTGILMPAVILGSWRGIEKSWVGYSASMLLLTTGMLGTLVALDLLVFYVFWEVMLVPMYLIIGVWGGERRIYAAVKFFIFTMAGSLLMLLGILWMAWSYGEVTGIWSFRYEDLLQLEFPVQQQLWLFGAFAIAFAIKVPMFPFHTWLPDAHVEAPTGGSVILAGVLLKLGTYGFLRFAIPFFPHAATRLAPWVVALAVIGVLYGALVAWAQIDMKKLVAYSSIAHLGFVMLGLFAWDLVAWQGALLQMVNHGLSTGALFLLVGMLYDRRHTKRFDEFGGLAAVTPWLAFILVFSTLASVGLPALNGFVGEFMILVGSWRGGLRWATILATSGVVLAAVYLLKLLQETLWGPISKEANRSLKDLSPRELAALVPLCLLMLWIGVAPRGFLEPSRPALTNLLATFKARSAAPAPSTLVLMELQREAEPATFVAGTAVGGGVRPR